MAPNKKSKNKRKKKTSNKNRNMQEREALEYVTQWCSMDSVNTGALLVDLHSHSTFSDGTLTPTQLLQTASGRGVKVLALTDHDTMAGVPEAVEAAHKYGVRLIPGVEMSTTFGGGELVHILGYYGCCGPCGRGELEQSLTRIREGRYVRAQSMVCKLQMLGKHITLDRVLELAGKDTAPGRPHVARALLEAGHINNIREAFDKYLYDGGPAYSSGYEVSAEEGVKLILRTGGIASLAHPWRLKNAISVIRGLKEVGLHAMEVYKSDGKDAGFAELASCYDLLMLGGSDFHGTGSPGEVLMGSIPLPIKALHQFVRLSEPMWWNALRQILQEYAELKQEGYNFNKLIWLGDISLQKDTLCLSRWLRQDERSHLLQVAAEFKLEEATKSENGNLAFS